MNKGTRKIVIEIDKKFIEDCVYQEEWGEVRLDSKELSVNIAKYIKDSCESIVRNVINEVVGDIARDGLRKELKEKVKSFISGMGATELYYRDGFRELLVSLAKENTEAINEKIRSFIGDGAMYSKIADSIGYELSMYSKISDSIGYELSGKFIKAIEKGLIE